MKGDRLLSLLLQLQARGRVTGRQLAQQLEVSMRTVHRDMEALSAAGVPVFALRGCEGGWQLDQNWRTQVPGLDEAELRGFLMAQPQVIGHPRLAAAAERALGKLLAAMPVSLRAQAAFMRERLYVDATSWRSAPEDLSSLPLIQDAVARDRKLSFVYASAGYGGEPPHSAPIKRIVDPLGLVAKGSTWYIVARSGKEPRTFRVSRISNAKLLDAPAARPSRFDLEKYWKASTEAFGKRFPRYAALLQLKLETKQELQKWISVSQVPQAKRFRRGWITARVEFDDQRHALFVVRGLGAGVDVIAPRPLRQRVMKSAAAVLHQAAGYGKRISSTRVCESRSIGLRRNERRK
jgi:predicted DNA-binding transcriptional regulator YafY